MAESVSNRLRPPMWTYLSSEFGPAKRSSSKLTPPAELTHRHQIEILYPDGKPVEQILLQAVRDSHVTFKPIDSVTDDLRVENWQEMELNQFMYLQGEVCKIFRMPQGPDSGFQFYSIGGKRRDYFATSGIAHALDEPAYIVQPREGSAKLNPMGCPSLPSSTQMTTIVIRKLGTDSRLLFKPPADGNISSKSPIRAGTVANDLPIG